ncbi:MAG: UDP-N-acetylmuramoyl-tripeptide--D-alanyl-D-alanine ligase [bacterium]|nr:UDP-N-acetylmuramoyl-tripeptide--D-alanyl-D-alanine ligase [bacterium]
MKTLFKNIVSGILIWESKIVLRKYKPRIVTVTGSVGKTSAKDAIHTVLATKYKARKSLKSLNSEIGVPLTILGLENAYLNPVLWIKNIVEGMMLIVFPFKYPEMLVLEVGADRPGDIESFSKWLKPDIAVITRFGDVPVHVEFFPSIEDLVNEKGYLVRELKNGGTFVLNSDDKRIVDFSESVVHPGTHTIKKISYGFNPPADVEASHEIVTYGAYAHTDLEFPNGMMTVINVRGTKVPVAIHGSLGVQHIYPVLSAFAVGIAEGMKPIEISQALENHVPPRSRMRLIAGIKDTVLIDDTYNSSPVAVEAALLTLKAVNVAGRKIAVLGDMMELGQYSVDEHKKAGKIVAGIAHILVTVGVRSRMTAEAALNEGVSENNILQFDSAQEAGKYLESVIKAGDIILVKGSQSMRMERIVEELMNNPEEKDTLLVRQEPQWLAKK